MYVKEFIENHILFTLLNAVLIAAILYLVLFPLNQETRQSPFSENQEIENLESPEHDMNLRYRTDGPLYNDMKANISTWVDRGADDYRIPAYRVETNSMGARDNEFSEETGNKSRIVFIGDSFTFGWGVNKSERYSEIAKKKLGRNSTYSMNIAVLGTGIVDYYLLFKHKALELDPDTVVIGFRYNDVRSEKDSMRFREEAREAIPENAEDRDRKISEYVVRKHQEFIEEQDFQNSPLREHMIKIAELASEENIDLVFYHIDKSNRGHTDEYQQLSEKYNFEFINAAEKLSHIPDRELIIRPGDAHYDAKGHRILGEHLAKELKERNITR